MVETESTLHVLQSSKVEWIEESRLDKTWTRSGKDNGRETKSRAEVEGDRKARLGEKEGSQRKGESERERGELRVSQQ